MLKTLKSTMLWLLLSGIFFAAGSGSNTNDMGSISKPSEMECGSKGDLVGFTCQIMQALLKLGPMVAVIALVLGGIIYIYAGVFVTADQRGKYHTLATSLAVGALILAALVGGAGWIVTAGMKFLTPTA